MKGSLLEDVELVRVCSGEVGVVSHQVNRVGHHVLREHKVRLLWMEMTPTW